MARKHMANVLFLCDDNSCRSPIAEALLNTAGKGRFCAFSGGFTPAKKVDPIVIEMMNRAGIPCRGLRPKGWRGFTTSRSPHIDIVVCLETRLPLSATTSLLPDLFPGNPIIISWQTENPATVQGSRADRRSAYDRMLKRLEERVLELARVVLPASGREQGRAMLTRVA